MYSVIVVTFKVVVPRTIQIYVKLPDGRSVPVSVQSTDPFSAVLSILEETEEVDLTSLNYHVNTFFSFGL